MRKSQSGQVMIIVAVWLVALIGSAALILLTGSVEWQRNQLQQLADQSALDAALRINVGCSAGSASNVINEADNFLRTQRSTPMSSPIPIAGSCPGGYSATDNFSGGLTATYHYPYRGHQQQVEVILTLGLPISFGNYVGTSTTNVTRRAVAQQLSGSTTAVSAGTLSCTGGQFKVGGSVVTSNAISLTGSCAVYAHQRYDAVSGTYSDLGNVSVYASGQTWIGGGGSCIAPTNAVCADGYEVSGHTTTTCGTSGTSAFLSAGDATINPNPCAGGTATQPVPPLSTNLPPEPDTDPAAIATLRASGGGALGSACTPGGSYGSITAGGTVVGTGLGPSPATPDASGFYHFKPSCYGFLDPSLSSTGKAVLDPGFYYFNGSGFAGGGGICLGGVGTLLARDVTLEFVNQAGFSSVACAPGGGTSTYWLQGTNGCSVECQLQTTDPNSGQQSVGFTPADKSYIWSETASYAGAQTVPAGTTYTLTYSSSGGRALNATVTLYYSVVTPCLAPTGATNLVSWSAVLPDFSGTGGNPVTSPASGAAIIIPAGAYLCLQVAADTAAGNENFVFNDTNHPGKISSSATILPAGSSSGCSATCQFGSPPCSLSACPPNAGADSPNNLTWFAAPCSSAPAADSASCLGGSSWCPTGDRSCWNELIWAPATNTGQIVITGTAAMAWLFGSVNWASACTDTVNGTSTLDGTLSCGTLSVSAAAGAGTAVGSDYGINTAVVEAVLVE